MIGVPLWLNIPLCLLAAVCGWWMGYRAHRRDPSPGASDVMKHSPHLLVVAVPPTALLIFHVVWDFFPELEWKLPYEIQYYYGVATWGIVLGCFTYFAGFGAAVFILGQHPKRIQLALAVGLLVVALQQFHWTASAYDEPAMSRPRTSFEGYVYQSSPSTCVPAAAATLLAVLGDPRSEAEMVRRMKTETDGTYPSQLVMAMRRLGYRERTHSMNQASLDEVRTPAILFLKDNVHAVTLLKVWDDRIELWDPNDGLNIISREKFAKDLQGAHAIEFHSKTSGL